MLVCLFVVLVLEGCPLEVLTFDEADEAAERVRIFHFSDLHWPLDASITAAVLAAMLDQKPDLIIFSGDLFSEAGHLGEIGEWLSRVPEVPRFSVIGNHEYWSGVEVGELEALYEDCGFEFLLNEAVRVTVRGRELCLVGLDDYSEGRPDSALLERADPDVVILHEPESFTALSTGYPALRKRLFFAGHTHGGQVTLFGLPVLLPGGSGGFSAGHYVQGNDVLFVSKGLGTSVVPLRIFAEPDVIVVDF